MANYILVLPIDPTWGLEAIKVTWTPASRPVRFSLALEVGRWETSALGTRLPERVTFKILFKPQPT